MLNFKVKNKRLKAYTNKIAINKFISITTIHAVNQSTDLIVPPQNIPTKILLKAIPEKNEGREIALIFE